MMYLFELSSGTNTSFSIGRFLLFTFYHLMSNSFGVLSIPVIYVMEGFNANFIFNLQLIGHNTLSFWIWISASSANLGYVYMVYNILSDKSHEGNVLWDILIMA
jgi:hypothetical protein